MRTGLHVQNQNGSIVLLAIIALFITLFLAASILSSTSTSSFMAGAELNLGTTQNDFTNYFYALFSNNSLCQGINLSSPGAGTGTFTVVSGATVVLQPGSLYPDDAGTTQGIGYLTVCANSTAGTPCALATPSPMSYNNSQAVTPGSYKNDFNVSYSYWDPVIGMTGGQTLVATVLYTLANSGAGPNLATCSVVSTDAGTCQRLGLTWCNNQNRCSTCESSGGCYDPASGQCSIGAQACPMPQQGMPTPGEGPTLC